MARCTAWDGRARGARIVVKEAVRGSDSTIMIWKKITPRKTVSACHVRGRAQAQNTCSGRIQTSLGHTFSGAAWLWPHGGGVVTRPRAVPMRASWWSDGKMKEEKEMAAAAARARQENGARQGHQARGAAHR